MAKTTVYICLPASEITRKRRWTRLLITEALCRHSDVKIIAPWGTAGLSSDGYNPLASLDPSNETDKGNA